MHRLLLTSLVLSGCLLGTAGVLTLPAMADDSSIARNHGDDDARVRRGFEIAPVKLSLHGRDRAKVGLGSYLVNAVSGCNDPQLRRWWQSVSRTAEAGECGWILGRWAPL